MLLPILLGIVLAVIPCIYLFSLAFEHLMFVLICIFAGFLIGSFPSITEKVKGIKPNNLQIALIITGALFVIALGVLSVAFGDKMNIGGLFENINKGPRRARPRDIAARQRGRADDEGRRRGGHFAC